MHSMGLSIVLEIDLDEGFWPHFALEVRDINNNNNNNNKVFIDL